MAKFNFYLLLFISFSAVGFSQESGGQGKIKPTIMVLPRTNEGGAQDLRNLIDSKTELRLGLTTVKDGFDQNGYSTNDFESTFNKVMLDEEVTSMTQADFKDLLFDNITADVVVELDVEYLESPGGNSARIIMEANILSSGKSLASKICTSNQFRTTDKGALITNALNNCFDEFLATIEGKWGNDCNDGRSVNIDFSIDEGSEWTMESKISQKDNLRLKYVIEDWLMETAFNGYVKVPTITEYKMFAEDYRYDCNQAPRHVERKIYRIFDEVGVDVKINNNRGSIYVTIM